MQESLDDVEGFFVAPIAIVCYNSSGFGGEEESDGLA